MQININGAHGEGGGQILRSSLALSMVTGRAFRIDNIRAARRKPGLMRQHLTAVRAAQAVCNATVQGDTVGSGSLTFEPGCRAAELPGGEHQFAVGTAGSATLVLQTVLPALVLARAPSTVTLQGGTHNPYAPPFDFLAEVFTPLLNRMGPRVELALERPGFYPAGGGRFTAHITPAPATTQLQGFELCKRGDTHDRRATAIVANLSPEIARRELARVREKLGWPDDCLYVLERHDAAGPGNIVMLRVESEHVTELFTGFGQRGVSAEQVATRAADACRRYLKADVPVGEHLADQLLLPLAIAGSGSFMTLPPSGHTRTHAELIGQFLGVRVALEQHDRDRWLVSVGA